MRLKRLEMVGFKSFAQRTVVEMNPGITAVVGPNGCGKSNIVDALRWAMGEQSARHLRGHQMEDVVFNGSDSLPATGMAEVSIVFDNEDGRGPAEYNNFSEIMVTRRLFRSGESEYAINKINCRLKDVVELFLGTGVGSKAYSIVEQGKVDELVNSKPEDRRSLIEEAAGTSKYKSRKIVAEKKLERTQQNLLRLNDIVREIERQIRTMELQAKKAERYRALKTELKDKELACAFLQRETFTREITQQENQLAGIESRLAGHLASMHGQEAAPPTVIRIEPANPQVVAVPAYDPTIVYGAWPYPAYPPYYPYPPGYFATGALVFGAGVAVGAALWGGADWHGGEVNINNNISNNFTNNVNNRTEARARVEQRAASGSGTAGQNRGTWQHNPEHRKGVQYRDTGTQQRYNRTGPANAQAREAYRGRSGQAPEAARAAQHGARGDGQGAAARREASPSASPRASAGGGGGGTPARQAGAFEGMGSGRDTQASSSRGQASRESFSRSTGASRPSGAAGGRSGGGRGGGGRR
jgi:recombinational DNA repair ATPase RecF